MCQMLCQAAEAQTWHWRPLYTAWEATAAHTGGTPDWCEARTRCSSEAFAAEGMAEVTCEVCGLAVESATLEKPIPQSANETCSVRIKMETFHHFILPSALTCPAWEADVLRRHVHRERWLRQGKLLKGLTSCSHVLLLLRQKGLTSPFIHTLYRPSFLTIGTSLACLLPLKKRLLQPFPHYLCGF